MGKTSVVHLPFLIAVVLLSVRSSLAHHSHNYGIKGTLPAAYICSNETSDSYSLGRAIGEVFQGEIKQFFEDNEALHTKLLPFVETAEGMKVYQTFLDGNTKMFGAYVNELHGMADGCGVPFKELFVQALSPELNLMLRKQGVDIPLDEACSDVMINRDGIIVMGHNEDGSDFAERAFFVHTCQPYPDNGKTFRFSAYVYPGNLMGNAMGYNSFGVVVTTNELFPTNIIPGKAMRYMLNRDLLNSASIEDAIDRASRYGCASGFNVNVGSALEKRIVTIEIGPSASDPSDTFDVLEVKDMAYAHFNAFLRMNVSTFYDNSSVHRLARAKELGSPHDAADIRTILGDNKDPDWPIYRDEKPPDYDKTLATGIFDLSSGIVDIYRKNPKTAMASALFDFLVIRSDA